MNRQQREDALTLEILQEIGARSDVTQRSLASHCGVALGLANSYLRRCVRKGLVKVSQAPRNRYLYYLTPKGFAEKSRLTADYLSASLSFYRRAAQSLATLLEGLGTTAQGRAPRLGLYGRSELAEIAAIRAMALGLEIVAVCEPGDRSERFLHLRAVSRVGEVPEVDVWVLTTMVQPGEAYRALASEVGRDRVRVPDVLGLGPNG
ncbi:MAG: winged helix-turn-helix transcriptional regulator [Ectothiorhodospiraceae bacterium]|nr:winged helix-turn-helix transcriptional regulator [Chromatiales bacterium]MCP5155638.1 winged helix-turn-helix transcriptional regulator [Ectothiorhodospiraceae bacterium]